MSLNVIVLAAGFSRRFGSAKQLHRIDGEPLVRRAATIAHSIAPAIVVIPSNAPRIRDALRGLDVAIVENAGAAEGMASSIRAGVRACTGDVLITLCDQPRIPRAHLAALIATGAPIAATAYADTLGVPAFFAKCFRDELSALKGDRGAKSILAAHRSDVVAIELEAAADDLDVAPRPTVLECGDRSRRFSCQQHALRLWQEER
jgi:CTP:molybdopterin cytidylyltransferase MocA